MFVCKEKLLCNAVVDWNDVVCAVLQVYFLRPLYATAVNWVTWKISSFRDFTSSSAGNSEANQRIWSVLSCMPGFETTFPHQQKLS